MRTSIPRCAHREEGALLLLTIPFNLCFSARASSDFPYIQVACVVITSAPRMAQQPTCTYFLAPSFRFKPGTGPIALGNIIADPLRPHRALTTVEEETLKTNYPRVEMITDEGRSIVRSAGHDFSMAIWSQFLQNISAKVSGERSVNTQATYTMKALETTYFVTDPSLGVIEARLRAPRVQAVIKASNIPGFRHPVYMVTGLMVAKGFAAVQEKARTKTGEVSASGDILTPAGGVGLGAGTTSSSTTEQSDTWKTVEDIIFAYQLLKIEVKGWRGARVEYDEFRHNAAFLSKDDSESGSESDGEDTDDEIEGQVTVCVAGLDNLSPSSLGGVQIEQVELKEGKHKITCISAVDV
ncbi:hypothetical protein V8C35DRAFT_313802, partial [Trichoderma chlorosporum]